jgi:hypothetical protein
MNPYRLPPPLCKRECERDCGREQVVEFQNEYCVIYLCEACADLAEKQYEDRGPWERVWILNTDES